jgi:hypothetical protein
MAILDKGSISAAILYVQGLLMVGVGVFALRDPEAFVAGTGDTIAGKPAQLLHSIRYVLNVLSNRSNG